MNPKYNKLKKINQSGIHKSNLARMASNKEFGIQKSPLVKSLIGTIKLEQDFDIKHEYSEFLIDKYK